MVMKLYGIPMSTCTTRVMFCLHEKGIEFELVAVDLFGQEHKQAPFLAKNPFGQVPVLEDGDLTIFESRAITAYLSEKYKDKGTELARKDDEKEWVTVKVWTEVESQQYNPAISQIVFQHLVAPMMGKTSDQAIIDLNLEKLTKVLDIYEERLSHTEYLAGDAYTLADLHHIPYTVYFMTTPWASLISDRPHVKAWWDRVSARPASEKVVVGMRFGGK